MKKIHGALSKGRQQPPLFAVTINVHPATQTHQTPEAHQKFDIKNPDVLPSSAVNAEFAKLFVLGFVETLAYYYSCDLRIDWTKNEALWYSLAGGLLIAGASRFGSMAKLDLKHLTKKDLLIHAAAYVGFYVIARLCCLFKFTAWTKQFDSTYITCYDTATFLLLAAMPLLKRRTLPKQKKDIKKFLDDAQEILQEPMEGVCLKD